MMKIAEILKKMIDFSNGNIHDIDHFIRVWTYARTIAEMEGLDAETQAVLEVAAITHDIACPLCREKYGDTNGKHQEAEGVPMVRDFLRGTITPLPMSAGATIRSCWRRTISPTPPKTGMNAGTWRISSTGSCGRRAARLLPKRFSVSECRRISRRARNNQGAM